MNTTWSTSGSAQLNPAFVWRVFHVGFHTCRKSHQRCTTVDKNTTEASTHTWHLSVVNQSHEEHTCKAVLLLVQWPIGSSSLFMHTMCDAFRIDQHDLPCWIIGLVRCSAQHVELWGTALTIVGSIPLTTSSEHSLKLGDWGKTEFFNTRHWVKTTLPWCCPVKLLPQLHKEQTTL